MAHARLLAAAALLACLVASAAAFEGNLCDTCTYMDEDWNFESTIYYENYNDKDFAGSLYFAPDHKNLSFWENYGFTNCNDVPYFQYRPDAVGRAACLQACQNNVPDLIHLARVQKVYTGRTQFYNEYEFVDKSYVPTSSGWSNYCTTRWSESAASVDYPFIFPARDTGEKWVKHTNGHVAAMYAYKIDADMGCASRVKWNGYNSVCRWGAVDGVFPSRFLCYWEGLNDGIDYVTDTTFDCDSSLGGCQSHFNTVVDTHDNIFGNFRRSAAPGEADGVLFTSKHKLAAARTATKQQRASAEARVIGEVPGGCWIKEKLSLDVKKASPFSPFP